MDYLHLNEEQMTDFPSFLRYNPDVDNIDLQIGDLVIVHPTPEDTEVSTGFVKEIKGNKFTVMTDFGVFKVTKNMLYPMYLRNETEKIQQAKELIKWFSYTNEYLQRDLYELISTTYNQEVLDFLKSELNYFLCEDCGEVCFGRSFSVNGKAVCESCRRNNYFECEQCGNMEHISNKEETNYNLCKTCQKREFILPYHRLAPPLKFNKMKRDEPLFLGVELEVDEGGERNDNVKKVMSIMNKQDDLFVYCMRDGSLNNGFEIITQPATLKAHSSRRADYEQCFNKLVSLGYLSHDTSTCGIHVHFNRDYFADNEELNITKLLYLVNKFWDEIVIFSRRNERRLDRYAKKIPTSAERYIRQTNKSHEHEHHYYSVNLSNENTIEFRMFKGSLNVETFFAILQFVRNLVFVAKNNTIEELQELTFNDLIVGKDCKSYWKIRSRYNNTEE